MPEPLVKPAAAKAPEAPEAIESILAPATPRPLPEPSAGGNYLRDPVTGALTLNPAHEIPQE